MDLGIAGKHALVCAASKGLGYACAEALVREGVHVTIAGRTGETLEAAVAHLRTVGAGQVQGVIADVTTDTGRAALLAACPEPDILVNNAGGPPPGDFREWAREDWIKALDANMLTPISLIRATVDGMAARGFGRIVNITSSAVKAPIASLGLSNGARTGLTGFVAGLARQVAADGVTINNLLPGPFETDRLRANIQIAADQRGVTYEAEAERRRSANPSRRFGDPAEFGVACAFLCSQHAAYITGQNLLLDGGAFPGTM